MSLRFWKTRIGTDARPHTRTPAPRLNVEALEARDVPAMVNLTTAGSSGVINGAIYQQVDAPSPDLLQSFVRLDADGVEQGYNTDARPVQFDERPNASVTRSLLLADVPLVNIGGVDYREFVLDINQTVANPRLSLDELRIFVGGVGDLSGYRPRTDTLAGLTAVYDMDAGANNWVQLNANLNRGGTSGDMRLYVPDQLFVGGSYVYVYSKFGVNRSANGGYEEWSVRQAASTLRSIKGVVFEDFPIFNDAPDPGEGMPDIRVYIDTPDQANPSGNGILDWTDDNGNGFWDQGEGEQWTTTPLSGAYELSGLAPGSYIVRFVLDDVPQQYLLQSAAFFTITLTSEQDEEGVNFWFIVPD
jgi:hypothetical protein